MFTERKSFYQNGEAKFKGPALFLVSVEDTDGLYGDANGIVVNAVNTIDNVISGKSGEQLRFKTVVDPDNTLAGLVWWGRGAFHLVLATNGLEIVASDPCFLPCSDQGLSIGIMGWVGGRQSLSQEKSWFDEIHKVAERQLDRRINPLGITVEEIAKELGRKPCIANIKPRRKYF